MIKKTVFLFLFLMSNLAHAVYIQIHFSRPVLSQPTLVVSTYYDDTYVGPFHVCIYNNIQGHIQILYHGVYASIIDAHFANQQAINEVIATFPETNNIYYSQHYFPNMISPNEWKMRPQSIPVTNLHKSPLPIIDEEKKCDVTPVSSPLKLIKRFRRVRCVDPSDEFNLYDDDDDDDDLEELKDWRQIPDFSYATLSGSHIEFFK